MNRCSSKWLLGALGLLAFAVACSGTTNVIPTTSQPGLAPGQNSAVRAALLEHFSPDVAARLLPSAQASCGKLEAVPGKYSILVVLGVVKHATFTADPTASTWTYAGVTEGKPPTPRPSTSPTTSPTSSPPPLQPLYVYSGLYNLKTTGHGCMLAITTVNGKPIQGEKKYSGLGIGVPALNAKYPIYKKIAAGPLSMTISSLSATGGHGATALKTTQGKAFDSGTVVLLSRVRIP